MKYVKPKVHEYTSLHGLQCSYHYVNDLDVESFHGTEFYVKWKEHIAMKPAIIEHGETRYYYADYKECALRANCWFV
ncbi:hypothetical protein EBR43_11640 [bacterium]|nr:hypothetical protein [bacterium]